MGEYIPEKPSVSVRTQKVIFTECSHDCRRSTIIETKKREHNVCSTVPLLRNDRCTVY